MSNTTKAGAGQPPRVLVAEDEALIRFDLVELLNDEGYEVVGQAGDGEAAVEMARELEPDLVVMDVKMPKMDGIAAAEIIASERIAPVVMLTAFSQRDLVERAATAGVSGYVIKPFDEANLLPAMATSAPAGPPSSPDRRSPPAFEPFEALHTVTGAAMRQHGHRAGSQGMARILKVLGLGLVIAAIVLPRRSASE